MISVPFFHERSITMSTNNKNLHLTDQDRIIIEKGIENSSTKAAIALTLVKDKSTIGKEIKAHRCSYNPSCANKDECSHNHVCSDCPDFKPFKYNRRDRFPGACNSCSKYTHCRYDKFKYSADLAHKEYRKELVDSRVGINMTYEELKSLANVIVPLIKAGQSPYQVLTNHPELNISKKTLYNYIEDGVFREFGLLDIDLRIKTKRKITKKEKTENISKDVHMMISSTIPMKIKISASLKWTPSITTVPPVLLCKHLNSCLTLSCLLYIRK